MEFEDQPNPVTPPEFTAAFRPSVSAVAARYRAILGAAVDGIIVIDANGIVREFNPAAARLFGYEPEDVLGHNVHMLMGGHYHREHDEYIARYKRTGEARIIGIGREVVGRRKDGSQFPMELSVGEIEDEGLQGFVGLIRDITQRRAIENQLAEREEELRLTFEQAPMAIATCDLAGHLLTANPAFCGLFATCERPLSMTCLRSLALDDDQPRIDQALAELDAGSTDHTQFAGRFHNPAGGRHYADVVMALVRNSQGEAAFVVVEIMDRTAEVLAANEAAAHREQLAQVGRLGTLGEMAAGIAHEINQPLTAVATYARAGQRLLSAPNTSAEVIASTLDKIAQQAERAGSIIEKIRRFVRHREPEVSDQPVADIFEDIHTLAEVDLRRQGLRLDPQLEADLPAVRVDPVQIQQVLLNLIRNAADAMQTQRQDDRILLQARRHGRDWLEIAVEDSGPGLDPAILERLFEPFTSTKDRGFGLGLSICKSLIDAHGGELSHEAGQELGGARFRIVLPVETRHDHG
jgi:two-component system sensor kinase FixL